MFHAQSFIQFSLKSELILFPLNKPILEFWCLQFELADFIFSFTKCLIFFALDSGNPVALHTTLSFYLAVLELYYVHSAMPASLLQTHLVVAEKV